MIGVERTPVDVSVGPLLETDLAEADRIFHLAFGTFLGLPDPMQFWPDRNYARARWRADPTAAFAAKAGNRLVATNFVMRWGSVGFFGPLTVHPDFWERGIANRLLEPTMELFAQWETKHAGLFTFAHSTKHVHLYQKFGFWPRYLTAVMTKKIASRRRVPMMSKYSELTNCRREECLKACRELTGTVYEGLDLEREIQAVTKYDHGDTVFIWKDSKLMAFAVCHCGPGTEAGSDTCYVKFGAARPGAAASKAFELMLDGCELMALDRGLSRIEAGVSLARRDAYQRMRARGFRTDIQGVTMHKPDEAGYSRSDVYVIDDWR
jgi:N-acetylglutamate synthase-like GNAT family acetyltransferase